MTQLATDISPIAPLQSAPVTEPLHTCPVRSRCMMTMAIKVGGTQQIVERPRSEVGTSCGFEQADTVAACPKRRRMEER